jgi:hypothetical protein
MAIPLENLGLEPEELSGLITGLEGNVMPIVDMIGAQQYDTTRDDGTIPILPSKGMLGRAGDEGIAEGVAAEDIDWELSTHEIKVRRFVGKSNITDGDAVALQGVNIPTATTILKRAMIESVAKQDKRFTSLIASTDINTEKAANNGVWTLDSSTPWEDLIEAHRLSNYGDMIAIGPLAVQALQLHPDTGSRLQQYAGGAIGVGEVAEVVAKVLGCRIALLGPRAYNSANPGQVVNVAYHADKLVWIGHSDTFVVANKESLYATEEARDIDREVTKFRYTRRRSITRAFKELGVILTGILS